MVPDIARATLTRARYPGQLKPPYRIRPVETEIDPGQAGFKLVGATDIPDLDLGLVAI